jgi:peptidoglycan/xylan/chitin deacetylase (PgdA/CDA1 family)
LLESRTRGSRRPRVAIAFDDGYVDNYDYAFPVLRERGLAATFFVTAGYVDGDPVVLARFRKLWGATSAELQPLSWGQIREMADAGMEIGCHTYSHPSLRHLSEQDVEIELRRSKQLLEERLGRPIVGHAYPIGKPGCTIGLREAQAAEGLGYRYAVTAVRRAVQPEDSPWLLPRFSASFPLDEQIAGSWDWRGYYNERAPIWIARALSPRAFRASTYGGSYEEMRAALQAKST